MRQLKRMGSEGMMVLLLCTTLASVYAPGFARAQAQAQEALFSLVIAGPQSTISPSAACEVTATLTNRSDKQIVVGVHNGSLRVHKDFEIKVTNQASGAALKQDESRISPMDPIYSQHSSARSKWLEPGESIQASIRICDLYDLSAPGTYQVQMRRAIRMQEDSSVVVSNTIQITVVP
jgi:hypothetical protein